MGGLRYKMPLKKKNLRVVLAQPEENAYPALADAIAAEQGLELIEIIDIPENIWRKVISYSPDMTVFYTPVFGDDEKRCINRVLRGVYSNIIVLTESSSLAHIPEDPKLMSYSLPIGRTDSNFIKELIEKIIKTGPANKTSGGKAPSMEEAAITEPDNRLQKHIIAIGASTGGTEALVTLFKMLPSEIPGIVVVQHMPPVFTRMYAERLNRELPFNVTEATENILVKPGSIHIAPGDRHLIVKRNGPNYYTHLAGTEKVNGHCPSVDVLFNSVAEAAGKNCTGIILTGMGADGARGLLRMKNSGAYTIGQDEKSSIVYGMPKKAYEYGAVIKQAALEDIAGYLIARLDQADILR